MHFLEPAQGRRPADPVTSAQREPPQTPAPRSKSALLYAAESAVICLRRHRTLMRSDREAEVNTTSDFSSQQDENLQMLQPERPKS